MLKRIHILRNDDDSPSYKKRFFLGFGKSKESENVRPGALQSSEVEKIVKSIGVGKKVDVKRVDYEGHIAESTPIIITSIHGDHFVGKVVNVERNILESESKTKVYIKGGGGSVDFYYSDGDISSIEEDIDNEIVMDIKENEEILEVLSALEINDNIQLSYFDSFTGGVISGTGKLIDKNIEKESFTVALDVVNTIEQQKPKEIHLSLDKHPILDLQIV
jgi:ribonuclease BN (tRNA processing enzyme)